MQSAQLHLMINHVPVIGMLCAIILLVFAIMRRRDDIRTISFGIFVLLAVITIVVYITGSFTEEGVRKLPGVSEASISRHEEMGEFSAILTVLLGIAATVGLIVRRHTGSIPKCALTVVLLMSIVTSIVVGITARLGGQIRHPEIRVTASAAAVP